MDARYGAEGYATSHYEGINFNPLILNGKIYYNAPNSGMREGRYILDLYTGKQLEFVNTTGPVTGAGGGFDSHGGVTQQTLSFAQILNVNLPNQMGGYPYLWSTSAPTANTWIMYDAYTGNTICQVANASNAGTAVYGKDGSILRYNIVNTGTTASPKYYLQVWNTTQAIWWHGTQQMYQNGDYSGFPGNNYFSWRPYLNATFDGSHGYSLNASIPAVQGSIRAVREDKYVIGGTQGSNNENGITLGNLWALNLKPDANGKITPNLLWNITFTPPSSAGNVTMSFGGVDPEDNVFHFYCVQTKQRWGYSLETGKQIWGPTAPEDPMKYYGMPSNIYKGMLISYTYLAGGIVYAYNITTGKLLWQYEPTQIGYESPYGDYPAQMAFIADNKVFIYSSPLWRTNPLWRGSYLRVLNATNGQEIWKVMHYGSAVIADGIVVGLNYYDNEIYAYGKGPSATTINAEPAVATQGESVLIQGTVTDQSPGAKDTPAIADINQQAWMEYLYQQQAKPTNAAGVPVRVTATDPNGNSQSIGTVNSDASGNYAIMWTPPVPGVYKVTAAFEGSNSYWGSSAEIAFGITAAKNISPSASAAPTSTAPAIPTPTLPQTAAPTPSPAVIPPTSAEPTATYIGVGVIIIIVVAVAAALVLRKKRL
jgi:outer membrane protein assembly factor BamB